MAEFDHFAKEYEGMRGASLAPIGGFNRYYLQQKVNMFLSDSGDRDFRYILDFGCGIGTTTDMIQKAFPTAHVIGMDVSEASIDVARVKNPHIEFGCTNDENFMNRYVAKFDAAYIANVFHHIKTEERCRVLHTVKSMLTLGGKIFYFEHNPYNPLTRWIVSRCTFDRHAKLISPKESRCMFREVGFSTIKIKFLLFFPHRLCFLARFEPMFRWLPIGAQYCVEANRSNQ